MTAFRKGDVCTIEVVVTSRFNETQVCVKPVDGYQDIYVKPKDLTMVRPLLLVGDMVSYQRSSVPLSGVIAALSGGYAWIDCGDEDFRSWRLDDVRRIDPEPEPAADETPPHVPDLEPRVPQKIDPGKIFVVEAKDGETTD